MAPSLHATDTGAWLTWLETADDGTMALRTTFRPIGEDAQWTSPETVTQRSDFFANWADVPRLCQAADGMRYATWLQQSGPGTYAYDIGIARAEPGGPWIHMGTLNDDRVVGEHGFVSMIPEGGGVRAFWLDGRAMTGDGHDGHGAGDMMLRTAHVGDHVYESTALDTRVCECCPTDAAMLATGPAVVVRDRGPEEERDIAIVRHVAHAWTKPAPVNDGQWRINGCPVNGPRIASRGERVAVVWFSSGGDHPGLRLAWSTDAGAHFGTPHRIDGTRAAGRPALVLLDDGAMVVWLGQDDAGQWLQCAVMHHDGRLGPVETLARVPNGRRAGVPQAAALGEHVLVVWVAPPAEDGGQNRLDGALLPVAAFPRASDPA